MGVRLRVHDRTRTWHGLPLLLGALMLCASLGLPDHSDAQSRNRTNIEIDHSATGFSLTGGHAQVLCERCHLQGLFRGTPTQCMQCHSPGGRVASTFKPANHLPTTMNCNSCHRTTNWKPAFFTHNGVVPGSCARCHNNSTQQGKPSTHIPTTMSCDNCHRTVSWTSVSFRHLGVSPGTCATCHNGVQARGKPSTHLVTSASCDACHRMGGSWILVTANYNHSGITTNCASCHNGTTALGKPANHFPTATPCENCHKSTTTFTGTAMNHTGIVTGCATCHATGMSWVGGIVTKPTTHITTSLPCENCHKSTTSFLGATYDHTGITGGCATCHNGTTALGKPATHIPTSMGCETCHKSTTAFGPGTPMNHTGIVTGCAICHSGGYPGVVSKPAAHFPTTAPCETCHKSTTSFAGTTYNHAGIVSGCATCHSGGYVGVVSKPANHFPTSSPCEGCHFSTTTFTGTKMVHTAATGVLPGGCPTCHERGMSWVGGIVTRPLNHSGSKAAPNSCDKSGCHRGYNSFSN